MTLRKAIQFKTAVHNERVERLFRDVCPGADIGMRGMVKVLLYGRDKIKSDRRITDENLGGLIKAFVGRMPNDMDRG